ncbi:Processing alpha glucosidase I [Mortierella sp. AM989]|nr:Processing alpha glucosidase I [Mortierella sp. AM989]
MNKTKPRTRRESSFRSLAIVGVVILGVVARSVHADSAMDPTDAFLNQMQFSANPEDISLAASAAQNQSLFWGPYRPNLYFGTRPRLPDTVMTGLMWYGTQDYSGVDNIRHGCEERDGFEKYGWLKNDGRTFGTQQLKDTRNNVEITTDFIKIPGGSHGGSWGARISGKPIREGILKDNMPNILGKHFLYCYARNVIRSPYPTNRVRNECFVSAVLDEPMTIAAMYYIGVDGQGNIDLDGDSFHAQSSIKIDGQAEDLGEFEFEVEQTNGDNSDDPIHFIGIGVPEGNIWRAKDITREAIIRNAQKLQESGRTDFTPEEFFSFPDEFIGGDPNMLVFQMHYDAPFEFEVRFSSKSSPNPVTSEVMTSALTKAVANFDERFERTFGLKEQGYSDSMVDFAKATMSNLVGGIGYFYGSAIVDDSPTYEEGQNEHLEGPVARRPSPDPKHTLPASLFTAVPSRSFFPRGFYWDEGFHQTLIGQWDNDLSLEIISSWFNRQDRDGWIQREQILGDEARSRVPAEFQVQYPEHANPPTFFKAINLYLDRLQNATKASSAEAGALLKHDVTNTRLMNPDLASEYLAKLYPKLRASYYWMRQTMRGGIREYGRQSRSRAEGYRWKGRTMTHTLTSGLDDYPRAPRPSLGELHVDLLSWIGFMNKNLQRIAEIVGEEDDVEEFEDHYNAIVSNIDDLHWSDEHKTYCDLALDEDEQSVHVCHKGYISLFPMLLGIIDPESEKLDHVLDLMYDPEEMWTPFGLRSLSAKDEFFGTGENYWKGPIWINVNYLAVHSLKTEYERTGYVWEQYNDKTGHGQRSHPFTGWTSMVVLMMQMGRAE